MPEQLYTFDLPVLATETTSIKASSLEEAIKKYVDGQYFKEPTLVFDDLNIGTSNLDGYLKESDFTVSPLPSEDA